MRKGTALAIIVLMAALGLMAYAGREAPAPQSPVTKALPADRFLKTP